MQAQRVPLPETVIVDNVTGFAVNLPAIDQGPYGWWDTYPAHYKAIQDIRKELGMEIEDFPDGRPEPLETKAAEGDKS